jgi:hypothetical protein
VGTTIDKEYIQPSVGQLAGTHTPSESSPNNDYTILLHYKILPSPKV